MQLSSKATSNAARSILLDPLKPSLLSKHLLIGILNVRINPYSAGSKSLWANKADIIMIIEGWYIGLLCPWYWLQCDDIIIRSIFSKILTPDTL